MEQDSAQPAAGQTRAQLGTASKLHHQPVCHQGHSLSFSRASPCPQSLAGSRGDPRPFACPSSPGLGAWSQPQATQETSSQAHCSLCLAAGAPAHSSSRCPPCPGRFTCSATFASPSPHSCRPKGTSTSPNPANSPQGELRAQGSSSPPQFQPDALGL